MSLLTIPARRPSLVTGLVLLVFPVLSARADVVINEFMAKGSERLLRWGPDGVPRLGFGTSWYQSVHNDSAWITGNGPFGFGSFANVLPVPAIGTNTATLMQNLTPTLYLRKSFTATSVEAANSADLSFEVQFNDGFVCYLNGVEVGRRNAGPQGEFKYRDSFAAMGTPSHTESTTTPYLRTVTLNLGPANTRLVVGTNILAVHVLNHWENSNLHNTSTNVFTGVNNGNNFYFKGDLKLQAATLAANNTAWKILPGVVEPSGGLVDPTLIFQARQNVAWGRASFDDGLWSSGAAPFGAGAPPGGVVLGTNLTASLPGQSTSLYSRLVFEATSAHLADLQPLQLLMDWDDGFVAYLNGVEIARDRMDLPHSFTPHNAVASTARTPGSFATYTLDQPSRFLVTGQNVLAIQVHNVSIGDADLFMRAQLRTNPAGTNATLVAPTATWRYYVGLDEPIPAEDENIEDNPEAPDASPDWIELRNSGAAPVTLSGWGLSDDPGTPNKWVFPVGASIPAGGYLVVICDDLNITDPATGGFYHTNFKLSAEGESVVLSNAAGTILDSHEFTAASAFESEGRDSGGNWGYLAEPSPGAANGTTVLSGFVEPVTFSEAPGFYAGSRTITLGCATPGATIRYTLDGSEPTATSGIAGTSVVAAASRAIRARAFKAGMITSRTSTGTYLINEPTGRQGVPALALAADEQRSLYRPYGAMAISGGGYTNFSGPAPANNNGIWTQTGSAVGSAVDLAAYNNVIHRGRFTEKPVNMEILRADGTAGPNLEFGLRISGSGHARPRYRLTNQNRPPGATPAPNDGVWSPTDFTQKPSFNFFFRNEFGGDPLEFPLFPDYPVTSFHDVRVRAGKNDPSNPFIEDEYVRRLFLSTGQKGSRGMINTLYVNGVYKGYYNLCEHIREDFLQRHHGGAASWDVRQVTTIASGDGLAFQEMITYLRSNPQTAIGSYEGMATRLDMVNFIDYLLTNLIGVTGDWPHNNFIASRERTARGIHRYYVWDAEGAFGDFGGNVRTNQFLPGTTGSIVTANPNGAGLGEGIRILYTLLRNSPEFKLLFADRIQKHFFNGGSFTEARMLADWNAMKAEFAPLIAPTPVTDRVTPWLNGVGNTTRYTTSGATNAPSRRQVLFQGYHDDTAGGAFVAPHFVTQGLWPATLAPTFSQYGGSLTPGSSVTITNPNASGSIYYTTDGSDPRAAGGAAAGTVYATPLVVNFTRPIRARVLGSGGEWSPLQEALFDTGTNEPLLITELMYHPVDSPPVDGDEYEFLEIKNVGSETVSLDGMRFTSGITYAFPPSGSIAPGARLVLAKSAARFAERYPGVTLFGAWTAAGGSLSNSGETVTLTNASDRAVFSVTYADSAPWPVSADGGGRSLVPVNPNLNALPDSAVNWRPSTQPGGSPGLDDPTPALVVYVNEALANSAAADVDWVELFNPNVQSVDLSHWWLSDSNGTPQKFRIPDGTLIPAGGYLVFTESDFAGGLVPFSLSENGERIRLSAGNALGSLTGYVDNWSFDASDPGRTFGRHQNSLATPFFVVQKIPSPAAVNAGPLIGPVVISELMYNPASGGDEFLEFRNLSTVAVTLFDPANPNNTWKTDGITFSFPPGVTLAPGEIALLSPLAPTAFRSKYGIDPGVRIFGPYTGNLSNGGERVRLQRPGSPYTDLGVTVVPFHEADAVTYSDAAPWPLPPDGGGPSLERVLLTGFGTDPQTWRASPANGGNPGLASLIDFTSWQSLYFNSTEAADPLIGGPAADPDGDGLDNVREWAHGFDPWGTNADPVEFFLESEGGSRYLSLRVRYSLDAQGLIVSGDIGTDVDTWTSGGATLSGAPLVHGDGTATLILRHPTPLEAAGRQFLRARFARP